MSRHHIYNFHNPRLSIAQSGLRAVIGHSQPGAGGAGLMQTRVASWNKGVIGAHPFPAPDIGVAAAEPAMAAVGTVLDQIDHGTVKTVDQAFASYKATRTAQAAATGAGTVSAGIGTECLDLVSQYLLAWVFRDQSRENQIESEFKDSSCDIGWLAALKSWLLFYWDGQAPVYHPPAPGYGPIALPPAGADGLLRVGVLGDWGTGEPASLAVLDQLMQQNPDVIVHLGDVYYAGTIDECATNFLNPMSAARAKYSRNIPVYTIPGNHDYYSGGKGFYALIERLNQNVPNSTIQEFSFFCLQNDQWQLECMDTGFNDHDLQHVAEDITHLEPAEAAWHQAQLLAAGSRTIILMSHHQLYSAFATIGAGGKSYQNQFLTQNLQDWRAAGVSNIWMWLWGHEHLLEIYADPQSDGTQLPILGRCVGHGAFPVFNNQGAYNKQPASPIPLQAAAGFPDGYIQTSDEGQVYANGYALLTLGSTTGAADYYQVNFTGSIPGATSQRLWTDRITTPLPADRGSR